LDKFYVPAYVNGKVTMGVGLVVVASGVDYHGRSETIVDSTGSFSLPVKPQSKVEVILPGSNTPPQPITTPSAPGDAVTMPDLHISRSECKRTILVAKFIQELVEVPFIPDLKKLGFDVGFAKNELSFLALLPTKKWDVIVIISDHAFVSSVTPQAFVEPVVAAHASGTALFLMADNAPYFMHANLILAQLPHTGGLQLAGNTPGKQILKRGVPTRPGEFGVHPITAGVGSLFEGETICYPTSVPESFTLVGTSSNGNPAFLVANEDNGHGRVVVDTGFTKLYPGRWEQTPGTATYVINSVCWLAKC